MRVARLIPSLLVISFFSVLPASAQVTTGTPPFGSFGGGPDIVDLANLNVQYRIPVIHRGGRGLPLNFDLSFNSSIWYVAGSGSAKYWQPVSGWGLAEATPIGFVTYNVKNTYCNGNTHIPLTVIRIGHTLTGAAHLTPST